MLYYTCTQMAKKVKEFIQAVKKPQDKLGAIGFISFWDTLL